jgi:succinylarginine dihydrolase
VIEVQIDSLVGLTHHFGAHAHGNLASQSHGGQVSCPQKAALQGLEKMKWVMDQGGPQWVLPPLRRPRLDVLQQLGFWGTNAQQLCANVWQDASHLLKAVSSSSFIWTANLGYVAPRLDTQDGKLHLSISNLNSHFHRQLEAEARFVQLQYIFQKGDVVIHPPVNYRGFEDEGAANHTRLEGPESGPLHIFVHGGRHGRQQLEAQKCWVRQSGLVDDRVLYLEQSQTALEGGVFHNDVIATGHGQHYFIHEKAYTEESLDQLHSVFNAKGDLILLITSQRDLDLSASVSTYLYNSQIIEKPNGHLSLLLPRECDRPDVQGVLKSWQRVKPMDEHFMDLGESMMNGGGPACLRWRCLITEQQFQACHYGVQLTASLFQDLGEWILCHYPEHHRWEDLQASFWWKNEARAFEELSMILDIPEELLL